MGLCVFVAGRARHDATEGTDERDAGSDGLHEEVRPQDGATVGGPGEGRDDGHGGARGGRLPTAQVRQHRCRRLRRQDGRRHRRWLFELF